MYHLNSHTLLETYFGKVSVAFSGFGIMLMEKLEKWLSVMAQCTVRELFVVSKTSLLLRLTACLGSVKEKIFSP